MFHERIKKMREQSNLSREELAKKLGISYSALSKYETGTRQPDFETLLKFSDVFGTSTDYLLTGEESGQLTFIPNEYGVFEVSANNRFPIRLSKALKQKNIDIERIAKILDVDVSIINDYLTIPTQINFSDENVMNLLEKISLIVDTPLDVLLCYDDTPLQSSSREEKDIAKRLEIFKNDLETCDGLAFDGEPMSEEAKESLLESMELLFRQTQRINKKFTPKKYREDK